MAPQTPSGEPSCVRAGDSWLWTTSFPEYPVSEGWALSYAFKGPGELLTTLAMIVSDGTSHTVTIPAADTAALCSGTYQWAATMDGSGAYAGRRHTVRTGTLVVESNIESADPSTLVSPDETLLAAINDVIYGRISDDVQAITIGGRAITKIPILELFAIRSRIERRLANVRNGGRGGVQRVVFS